MNDDATPPGRLNWPSCVVVVSSVGLTLLHSWLLITALWGGPLRNLDVVLTAPGKLLLWSMWLFTVLLALLALMPYREGEPTAPEAPDPEHPEPRT